MLAASLAIWERSSLRRRFDALSTRERRLAMAVAVVGGLFLVYAVVSPLLTFHATALARYAAEQQDLQWMRANRSAVKAPSGDEAGGVEPQTRLSTINAAAKARGLPLRRIQPEEGAVSVQIERQPFETVIRWSHALETQHGMEIVDASVDAQEPGVVNARFRVR